MHTVQIFVQMPKYEVLSDFHRDYTSFRPYDTPSPSYSVHELIRYSIVDLCAKKETYAMDFYHKEFEHVCQSLDEGHLMEDILCEPHNLSGSLEKGQREAYGSREKPC